jgi:hypothetical protein
MLMILLLFASAIVAGNLLFRCIRLKNIDALEYSVLTFPAGLGLLCLVLFFMGHVHLFSSRFISLLLIGLSAPGPFILFNHFRFFRFHGPAWKLTWYKTFIGLCTGAIIVISLIRCFSPIISGNRNDEINLHLSTPKEWINHQGINVQNDPYSFLAGNTELLYVVSEMFYPGAGSRFISWMCMIWIAFVVYAFGRKYVSSSYGAIAAIIVLVNPLLFRSGSIAFVDIQAGLFVAVSILMLLAWKESFSLKHLFLCGFFAGIGCGIKPVVYLYTLMLLLIFIGMLLQNRKKLPIKRSIVSFGMLTLIIIISAAPWPLRNYLLTGSPTFPPHKVFYAINGDRPFTFGSMVMTPEKANSFYEYYHSRVAKRGTGIKNFFLLPWNITMHPEDLNIGDSIGTIMLTLLPLIILFRRKPPWVNYLLVFCGGAVLSIYLAIIPEARYYIPVFICLSIPGAWIIEQISGQKKSLKLLMHGVLLFNVLWGALVAVRIGQEEIRAVFSPSYRMIFCEKYRPFNKAFEYLQKNQTPDRIVVFYPEHIWYYLSVGYTVDSLALEHHEHYKGNYLLDIDYSQTLARDLSQRSSSFIIRDKTPEYLEPVFSDIDAKVYRFRE